MPILTLSLLSPKRLKMAFAGVLNDAEVKAALDGCSGEQLIIQ